MKTSSTYRIFKSDELHKQYEEEGYAVFELLDAQGVSHLRDFYSSIEDELNFYNDIHITMINGSIEQRQKVADEIQKTIRPQLKKIFQNYQSFQGSYLVKSPSSDSNEIPLHQDWNFVEEDKGFRAGTLWIALNDIDKDKGTIGVIPKSHLYADHPRLVPDQAYTNPFYEHREKLMNYLQFIDMKAGTAILWNHRLLHGSLPNTSTEKRITISAAVTHEEAELCLYSELRDKDAGAIGIFPVDQSFFIANGSIELYQKHMESRPINDQGHSRSIPNLMSPLSWTEIEQYFQKNQVEKTS